MLVLLRCRADCARMRKRRLSFAMRAVRSKCLAPLTRVCAQLEEIQETAEEYLALAKKYFAGKAEAGPFAAAKRENDKRAAKE